MPISPEHKKRWITALVLLVIIGLVALANTPLVTWIFFGVVYAFALLEAIKLFKVNDNTLYYYGIALWIATPFYPHPSDLLFIALMIQGGILAYKRDLKIRSLFPILYPGAGVIFLWMLYIDYGMLSLFWILAIVALSDVGAYYIGKAFGKRQFSPTSPNKTLEGVFGGVTLGTIGGTLLMIGHYNLFINAFFIALFTSVSAIFGDLFESYLKREAGLKDSGSILPGHGGVLDRIDGYLFAGVTLYVMLKITGS